MKKTLSKKPIFYSDAPVVSLRKLNQNCLTNAQLIEVGITGALILDSEKLAMGAAGGELFELSILMIKIVSV